MEETQGPVTVPRGIIAPGPAASGPPDVPLTEPAGQAAAETPAGQAPVATSPTVAPDEPTFFDPNQVPPELLPAYKLMQGNFTRKMQTVAQERQKIEAYDAFTRDPVGQIKQLAQQYGLNLTPQGQSPQGQPQSPGQDWAPNSWDEVFSEQEKRMLPRIMEQLSPYLQQVQTMRATNVETQLSQIDPNWKVYETDMLENLKAHPTLVNDVGKLYRMSVPDEVSSSRAVQAAIRKLQDKTDQAQVSARPSSAARSTPAPRQAKNFQEAVEIAKEELAQRR